MRRYYRPGRPAAEDAEDASSVVETPRTRRPEMQTNCGDTTPVLMRDRIRTPEGKSVYVRALFARIADRYDFITVALSYGQDRRWKQRLVDYASDLGGAHALDLATGTGDVAFALAERGARVVGLDITPRMIELAR